jgi:hypothetical protein
VVYLSCFDSGYGYWSLQFKFLVTHSDSGHQLRNLGLWLIGLKAMHLLAAMALCHWLGSGRISMRDTRRMNMRGHEATLPTSVQS